MKNITRIIGVDELTRNVITRFCSNGVTIGSYGQYVFTIKNDKHIDLLNKDLDKKLKNIRIVYEFEEEILDEIEKKYLSNLIRPFKNDNVHIVKYESIYGQSEYIQINLGYDEICLPYFKKGKMYKNMECNKEYSLKELGL
jgi:hypothetical protein